MPADLQLLDRNFRRIKRTAARLTTASPEWMIQQTRRDIERLRGRIARFAARTELRGRDAHAP
jgi:hypothetical protein